MISGYFGSGRKNRGKVWRAPKLRCILGMVVCLCLAMGMCALAEPAGKRYLVSCNGNYKNQENTLGKYQTLEQAIKAVNKQKKKTRAQWYVYDLANGRKRVWPELKSSQEQVNRAVAWAKAVAEDPRHGYSCYGEKMEGSLKSKWDRWGRYGDYSCSTLIVTAYELTGFADLRKTAAKHRLRILQTGREGLNSTCMAAALKKSGRFKNVTKKVRAAKGTKNLKPGDVLVQTYHVAMYIGNGKIVEARMNELGREYAKTRPGDQTGAEIRIGRYYGGWNCIYRPVVTS
ncbi:MAG: NlpC/P60 family protein [Lachnospiraceae bacterium]|nr:NlpC/P60 family protein [Lachnospiraceae bacterium]